MAARDGIQIERLAELSNSMLARLIRFVANEIRHRGYIVDSHALFRLAEDLDGNRPRNPEPEDYWKSELKQSGAKD